MGGDNLIVARGPAFVYLRQSGSILAEEKWPSRFSGVESISHSHKVQIGRNSHGDREIWAIPPG
jgi:hypothetical protein